MSVKIPYVRKKISSTLLALSAAIALLLSSTLLLSNLLLQPVQAQTTPLTFRTVGPADGTDPASRQEVALTFDAHGTTSSSDPQRVDITNGTIQLQADPTNNGKVYTGEINGGRFTNTTSGGVIDFTATIDNLRYSIFSECSTSESNDIQLSTGDLESDFYGGVECSSSRGGGGNTASSMTGSTESRDSDGDGIPDSNDRCASNSNQRCFKEGDTSTTSSSTTTHQQPSSSNGAGNQTRG